MSKSKEVTTKADAEALENLRNSYPVEAGFQRVLLPRLGFYSQDKFEGKGKSAKLVQEAGIFFSEHQTDEVNDEGKKVWEKEEIGDSLQAVIVYQRKQLKYFDGEKYTSSPIYDTDTEVLPLFKDKEEVHRGTPAELKAIKEYQGVSAKGKAISKLEENRVLYVLYKGELHQLSLRGTSMYSFLTYARNTLPPSVLTKFTSEPKENGAIAWNVMNFDVKRDLNANEIAEVQEHIDNIKKAINDEKAYYSSKEVVESENDKFAKELKSGKDF